jgi:hypothetical protein
MKYPKLAASKNWPNREQFAAKLRILEGEEPLRREKNADSTIHVSRGLMACPHCSETFCIAFGVSMAGSGLKTSGTW